MFLEASSHLEEHLGLICGCFSSWLQLGHLLPDSINYWTYKWMSYRWVPLLACEFSVETSKNHMWAGDRLSLQGHGWLPDFWTALVMIKIFCFKSLSFGVTCRAAKDQFNRWCFRRVGGKESCFSNSPWYWKEFGGSESLRNSLWPDKVWERQEYSLELSRWVKFLLARQENNSRVPLDFELIQGPH